VSWDVDEAEFYETFAEIAADPTRGPEDAMRWAWSALDSTQQELRNSRRLDNEDLARAYDMGRDKERAAVVAWLRQQGGRGAWTVVDAIERGEHRREEEP